MRISYSKVIKKLLNALVFGFVLLGPGIALAADSSGVTSFLGWPNLYDLAMEVIAYIANTLLALSSWLVAIAGNLLNVSISITLHIKDFVDSTPAIYQVWQAIRDVSGIFIIFFLLYAAFSMILGNDAKLGNLIKNIVVAGVLINFSFFFTSVLIDASNMVSLAIYHSMLPNNRDQVFEQQIKSGNLAGLASASLNDGGLSAIFMQNLQIQSLYNAKGLADTGSTGNNSGATNKVVSAPLKMILIGGVGIMIMLAGAASFTLAAGAFLVRLVILLFLLAFSPVFCASWIIPQLKDYAKQWKDTMISQLIFMPVYLLLTYVALTILNGGVDGSNSGFLGKGYASNLWQGTSDVSGASFIVLAINFALVIIMLNAPLLIAIKLGGTATSWIGKNGFGPNDLWKGFGSQLGSRTLGRAAYAVGESRVVRSLASSMPGVGGLIYGGLSKVSTSGFGGGKSGGYEARLGAQKKAQEALYKKIGKVDRGDFAEDEKGQAKFKIAQEKARWDQKRYVSNLPWKGFTGGIIGFMMDNRANRQTASKLNKEMNNEEIKNQEKSNRKKIAELRSELATVSEEDRVTKQKEIDDLQEKIDKAQELREEEKTAKIISKIEDLEKKGGSGGSKEEPKKS